MSDQNPLNIDWRKPDPQTVSLLAENILLATHLAQEDKLALSLNISDARFGDFNIGLSFQQVMDLGSSIAVLPQATPENINNLIRTPATVVHAATTGDGTNYRDVPDAYNRSAPTAAQPMIFTPTTRLKHGSAKPEALASVSPTLRSSAVPATAAAAPHAQDASETPGEWTPAALLKHRQASRGARYTRRSKHAR